ncbi:MAG: GNAT family N-acetyltransferase [Oscillospiraceae bacterium]|nr:GNAT family N-acetyltransferase [Oscillospiraceae bacterium]
MIRLCDSVDIAPADPLSARIVTCYRGYGTGYGFCRFYTTDNALLMHFNSSVTVLGAVDEELCGFIRMLRPATIETQEPVPFEGYRQREMSVLSGCITNAPMCIPANEDVYRAAEITAQVFGEDFSAVYTDLSHRVRHGVTDVYTDGRGALAADRLTDTSVYVSAVAVLPEYRRQGVASGLMSALCGRQVMLCCERELIPFYEPMGLRVTGRMWAYDDLADTLSQQEKHLGE